MQTYEKFKMERLILDALGSLIHSMTPSLTLTNGPLRTSRHLDPEGPSDLGALIC